MDLEESEYYVLKDIMYLIKIKIYILIELHPTKYKRGQMKFCLNIIQKWL